MKEVNVRFIKAKYTQDRKNVIFYFKEASGARIFGMLIASEHLPALRYASEHEKIAGSEYIHGRFREIMEQRFGSAVKKMSIPAMDGNRLTTLVHFAGPSGEFIEKFIPSDALAIALHADCPITIEAGLFEEISKDINIDSGPDDGLKSAIKTAASDEKISES